MLRDVATPALTGTFFLALATAVGADQPAPPAWGRIDDSRSGIGRYTFEVTNWPVDGRLAVPRGFPEIVRGTVDVDGNRQDLVVEYDADTTSVALVAAEAARPAAVAVDTADETRQFDDGRIVLTARTATVNGTHAKLEEHPANHRIGFWSDASDSVSWTQKLTRWGAYDVRLTYSTASPSGTEIEVGLGDAKLAGRLESTGSWYRYATIPLGRVAIPAAGDLPVTVRCTKLVGAAVMNLKAITLTPACEGTPPVQAVDGTVTLHGRDATVRGTMLRWEPAEKKQTLGFWTRRTDAAEWTFTVRTPGTFDVEVLQGCGTGQGGSEMAIEIDEAQPTSSRVAFTVEDTGGFQAFRQRTVGRVTIGETGDHTLRVQPKTIAKAAACDIRQIQLVPVTQ